MDIRAEDDHKFDEYQIGKGCIRDTKDLRSHIGDLNILPAITMKSNNSLVQERILFCSYLYTTTTDEKVGSVHVQVLRKQRTNFGDQVENESEYWRVN